MRSHFATAMAVVGTVVGAGFASGREIQHFFVRFGPTGLWGAVFSALLMSVLGLRVAYLSRRYQAQDVTSLMTSHLGRYSGPPCSLVLSLCMWLGLGVMLSGAEAAGQSVGFPSGAALALTALMVIMGVCRGISGLRSINMILAPIIMLVVLYLLTLALGKTSAAFLIARPEEVSLLKAAVSAILYAAFNSMLLAVVIPPLLHRDNSLVGIASGFLCVSLLLAMVTAMLLCYSFVTEQSPLPLLEVVRALTPQLPGLYAILLWAALATTALANAYGVSAHLQGATSLSPTPAVLLAVLSTLPLALQPFSRLVATVYPLLGYVALFVVAVMLLPGFKKGN